jgi:hypothetical protein
MTSVAVDQLVRENAILIKENPSKFFEEKGNLQAALKYMEEDNGVWKFKSTVPTANAMNIKNRLGMDNSRMKRIASEMLRKENRITKDDQVKRWLVIGVTVAVIGGGAWWLYSRSRRTNGNLSPFTTKEQSPSVFDAIMKKPKRTRPRRIVKKMVTEEYGDDDNDMDIPDDAENEKEELDKHGEEA